LKHRAVIHIVAGLGSREPIAMLVVEKVKK
jgi:hypothetical protein